MRGLADEFVQAFWPWEVTQYPGKYRGFSALLGISPGYARNRMQGRQRLPLKHGRRLVSYLEDRMAHDLALLQQLREYVVRQERDALLHPHRGYTNGIAKWRREQAAKKAASPKVLI